MEKKKEEERRRKEKRKKEKDVKELHTVARLEVEVDLQFEDSLGL
jgi:hypothetical protein